MSSLRLSHGLMKLEEEQAKLDVVVSARTAEFAEARDAMRDASARLGEVLPAEFDDVGREDLTLGRLAAFREALERLDIASELQLTFVDDKTVVQLPMLNDEFATHLCEIACVQYVILFPFPIQAVVLTPPLRRQVRLVPLGERTGSMRRAQEPAAIDTSHLQNLC